MTVSKVELAFRALVKLGGMATSKEIARELGFDKCRGSSIQAGYLMSHLVQEGRVERLDGRGVYRIKGVNRLIF